MRELKQTIVLYVAPPNDAACWCPHDNLLIAFQWLLQEHGAGINDTDELGNTALSELLVFNANHQALDYLIEQYACIPENTLYNCLLQHLKLRNEIALAQLVPNDLPDYIRLYALTIYIEALQTNTETLTRSFGHFSSFK